MGVVASVVFYWPNRSDPAIAITRYGQFLQFTGHCGMSANLFQDTPLRSGVRRFLGVGSGTEMMPANWAHPARPDETGRFGIRKKR
jgi:hypothetical protein